MYEYKFYMPSTEFYRTEPTSVNPSIQYIQFHALNILLLTWESIKMLHLQKKIDILKFFDLHFCFKECVGKT